MNRKLKQARLMKGLTQQEMADLLGYKSKSGYFMIESERNHPPLRVALKIAEILGVELKDIFEDFSSHEE